VLGDDKYGDFVLNHALAKRGVKRLFLHARRLRFRHPAEKTRISLESPLPNDMTAFCKAHLGSPPHE
jgi:23S rRNA pseudouridine955/2504/2580 synthase